MYDKPFAGNKASYIPYSVQFKGNKIRGNLSKKGLEF
jgi:hypothetical protein